MWVSTWSTIQINGRGKHSNNKKKTCLFSSQITKENTHKTSLVTDDKKAKNIVEAAGGQGWGTSFCVSHWDLRLHEKPGRLLPPLSTC